MKSLLNTMDQREAYFSSAQSDLVIAFPGIIETYLQKESKANFERNRDILNKRFALNGESSYTLEDIGSYYDVTRERIRQIESRTISNLNLLLSGQLKTKNWRIDHALVENYLSIKERIRKSDSIILKYEIDSLLNENFGNIFAPGYLNLFMEVVGYTSIPHSFRGFRGTTKPSWCLASKYQKKEIESVFQALDVIFDSTSSIRLFDLTVLAKKKAKGKFSNDSIHIALKACNEIEIANDTVNVKFCYLKSAADKAYRVLEAHGKALHYSVIAREINMLNRGDFPTFKPIKERNLTNQLVGDNRFVAIGKSGEWGLASWKHLKNLTIVEAIENALHQAGAPMSFKNICDEVLKLRPDAAKRSITTYLNTHSGKFTRVGDGKFALTAWRIKQAPKKTAITVSNTDFFSTVKLAMANQNPIPFPELINFVSAQTGLSEISVRQRINHSSHFKTSRKEGEKFKVVFCSDLNFEPNEQHDTKQLLRDKIQNEIRAVLFDNPNVPFKKGDLYKEISKNITCLRPTFYHYLDEMEDVRQYQEGKNFFAVHDHKEIASKVELNVAQYQIDETLKRALLRPLSMLTLDDVDMGLFELGLIFENGLRDYLMKAKEKSVIQVHSKDLDRLTDMINCVVREGIVTKGHHLNTLKEERNNRAHGKIPELSERRDLFNKAHYIADLFVKYIVFFYKKKTEL
jgi:DNA-directed RNA polymerase delta subunit